MNAGPFIGIMCACQGVFLGGTILLLKRGPRPANVFLGLLILLFSLFVLEFALYWTEFFYDYPHLSFTTTAFPLLFGPLLFFYILELKGNPLRRTTAWLHVIPFALYVAYLLPEYLTSPERKLSMFMASIHSEAPAFSTYFYPIEIGKWIHLVVYLSLSVHAIWEWPRSHTLHLRWTKVLLLGFVLFALFDGLHTYDLYYHGYQHINLMGNMLFVVASALIYVIGYKSLQKPEIIVGKLNGSKPAYQKSNLSLAQATVIQETLTRLMEQEKIYLNASLSLPELARQVGTSTHHLSQVLNNTLGSGFFDYVNRYRIEEAKSRLVDAAYKHLSVEGIALEVGFRNKSSFNTAFSKFTGITPSKFRESRLQYQ